MTINPDGLVIALLITAVLGGWVGFGIGVIYAARRFRKGGAQ